MILDSRGMNPILCRTQKNIRGEIIMELLVKITQVVPFIPVTTLIIKVGRVGSKLIHK
jgi:hypothetical protein